jgi:hemin uptake protein HemP
MSTGNSNEEEETEMQRPMAGAGGGSPEVRTVVARDLLGTRGIVRIEHEGETYTLRVTRNNRLILTK